MDRFDAMRVFTRVWKRRLRQHPARGSCEYTVRVQQLARQVEPVSLRIFGEIAKYVQRQLCSGSARDNVGAREQGSERGSHEILLVLGRQTTWAVDRILSTPGLSDDDRIAILGGTAVGLLGIKSSKGRDPQPARQNFRHPARSQ